MVTFCGMTALRVPLTLLKNEEYLLSRHSLRLDGHWASSRMQFDVSRPAVDFLDPLVGVTMDENVLEVAEGIRE